MIAMRALVSPLDSRTTLVGKTGTGKTQLVYECMSYYKHVVAYDIKAMLKWPEFAVYDNLRDLKRSTADKRIYRPGLKERRDLAAMDEFFFWIYNRGNTTLYVDEVANVGLKAGGAPLDGYHACITMGREKGITLYQSTQRPFNIPIEVLSESERFFVFWLNMPQDRERMAQILPIDEDEIQALNKSHAFYFSDAGDLYGPYQLDSPNIPEK